MAASVPETLNRERYIQESSCPMTPCRHRDLHDTRDAAAESLIAHIALMHTTEELAVFLARHFPGSITQLRLHAEG